MCKCLWTTVAVVGVCPFGLAQTDGQWGTEWGSGGTNGTIRAISVLDTGGGPVLYVAGDLGGGYVGDVPVNGIARWNGGFFENVGTPIGNADAITLFDNDGDGPVPPWVVIARSTSQENTAAERAIECWNGSTWAAIQPGSGLRFLGLRGLVAMDDDGDGPNPTCLFTTGTMRNAAGQNLASGVLRWNGQAWSQVGTFPVADPEFFVLASHDPDGPGPAPARLIAAGRKPGVFTPGQGTVPHAMVALWDGQAWTEIGQILQGGSQGNTSDRQDAVRALLTFDFDGAGPEPASLVAAGDFTNAGTTIVNRVARWNGMTWLPIGSGFSAPVGSGQRIRTLTTFDPDGSGPSPRQLVAGGNVLPGVAAWDGASWVPLRNLAQDPYGPLDTYIACEYDDDADGPGSPSLFASATFNFLSSSFGRWTGVDWAVVGDSIGGRVNAIASFDADGEGPGASELYIAGRITSANGRPVNSVLRRSGNDWVSVAGGVSLSGHQPFELTDLVEFDMDGAGPAPSTLYTSNFPTSLSGPMPVWRFDASAWTIVEDPGPTYLQNNSGGSYGARAICVYDDDGPGSNPAKLYAGGRFRFNRAGVQSQDLAVWDGQAWGPVGPGASAGVSGFNTDGTFSGVHDLQVYDPDGEEGPTLPMLVIGGTFDSVYPPGSPGSGVPVNYIVGWNGTAWQTFGSGMNRTNQSTVVYALTVWDADGDGPNAPLLVAGGSFLTAGGVAALNIAAWNGTQWSPVGAGLLAPGVRKLGVFDPDGDGPNPPLLIAGGTFGIPGLPGTHYLASWNGTAWSPLGSGLAMECCNPVGVGALAVYQEPLLPVPSLFVGGDFTTAGGIPSRNFARWGATSSLAMGVGPPSGGGVTPPAGEIQLGVDATGNGPFYFQWFRGATALTDSAHVSGSATADLRISDAAAGDAGSYSVRIRNARGGTVSATVGVEVRCIADFDDGSGTGTPDGGVTVDDLLYYLAIFEGGAIAADVDDGSGTGVRDGGVTIDDLLYYLFRFEQGC